MRKSIFFLLVLLGVISMAGCVSRQIEQSLKNKDAKEDAIDNTVISVLAEEEIKKLEDGLFVVRYEGDYSFDKFLSEGGASSDREVIEFLTKNLLSDIDLKFLGNSFGCSTIAVEGFNGESLFGRNFDWNFCEAIVVVSHPKNKYASISTVNLDFIRQGAKSSLTNITLKMDTIKTIVALYAPLDGMNEKGLVVSVNMIQDSDNIEQNTKKPDITTTTAIRLLLDKAATVEEALELLKQYDMHASMGMMVHFALADTTGRSVVVEYVDSQMVVTETPVVTNFYLAEGEKNGIGTAQSHERYNILMEYRKEKNDMREEDVKEALDLVSKDNFGEFESTEWSIVFNQTTGQVTYYHRENYEQGYTFAIK